MSGPELLILAPAADDKVFRHYVHNFLDFGVWFPFDDAWQLPESLPESLEGVRCIVIDPRRGTEFEVEPAASRLAAFQRGGGYVCRLNLNEIAGGAAGDHFTRHAVSRAIMTAGLTVDHPALRARLQAWPEEALVPGWRAALTDELEQYARLGNPFGDPTGYVSFRAGVEAAAFFGEAAAADPVWAYIDRMGPGFAAARSHCGGRFLLARYEQTGNRELLDQVVGWFGTPRHWSLDGVALNQDLSLPPGADWENPPPRVRENAWTWPEQASVAADTLPELSRVTGDPSYLERAVTHVLGAHKWLYDREIRLWRHVGRPDGPDRRTVPWGRGNAWFLFALRGLLEGMLAAHPRRGEVVAALRLGLEGLLARQQPSGLWLNVLDATAEESRPCASATSRFLRVFAQAYVTGWLRDERIPDMVERAWAGMKTRIWDGGSIANCVGTAYGVDRQVYLARPHDTFRPSRSELLLCWIWRERLRKEVEAS